MELIQSFKKYLVTIIPNIVYKSNTIAESYETTESRLNGDRYVEAKLNMGSFETISSNAIPKEILNQVGIYDDKVITSIMYDKYVIPRELQSKVYSLYSEYIINTYEELNNYYRTLCGLPDLEQESIYLNPSDLLEYGYDKDSQSDYDNNNWDKLTPLHKLPRNILLNMEKDGYLDSLYEQYSSDTSDVEYITFLGSRRIDPVISRMADQYELLYVPTVENSTRFVTDFKNYYEEARQYFMTQIYNYHYNSEYDYYEGYMGFFIMNMAIQRMINSLFEVVVQRDFYDVETCRIFLESYGIPFISTFTFNQQIMLVKKLNILLMEKCTTTVIYDLLDILNYDNYTVTKYLLVKQHRMLESTKGIENIPYFPYKTVLNRDGDAEIVLDKQRMYNYYFISADTKDTDVTLLDESDYNSHSYKSVTEDDVYWIEDEDLITKLEDDEFNFVETKYTGINLTIRMYEMLFEHAYLQKLICDKASETSNIRVSLPAISSEPLSLLEVEVLLICLLCKYNGTSADIIKTPSKTLAVLGFNFDADLEAIKEDIRSHPSLYSQDLIMYINSITFTSVSDVNKMYSDIKQLSKLLISGMENTTSEKVYRAYQKLYKTLFITDIHNEVFNVGDEVPDTYMDWLYSNNANLYSFVQNLDEEGIIDKIDYITSKCIYWFDSTKYLDQLKPIDDKISEGIIRILRWFKSYTIDISHLEVIYRFDSKYYNLLKLMDTMYSHANASINEFQLNYSDWVAHSIVNMNYSEVNNKLKEFITLVSSITVNDNKSPHYDLMSKLSEHWNIPLKDNTFNPYSDLITKILSNNVIKEKSMKLHDSIILMEYDDYFTNN